MKHKQLQTQTGITDNSPVIINENITSQIIRPRQILILMSIMALYIISCYLR